jgi:hypothetical protein
MPDTPTENTPERSAGEQDEYFEEEEFDPEEAERRITQFVTSAGELPGPSVEELAGRVVDVMQGAWADLQEIMAGKPHNPVLATELLLGQRARTLQPTDLEQWQLHAATSLLGGIVVRNVEDRDKPGHEARDA